MNYQKVDAALAGALEDVHDPEERVLTVFIHTVYPPDAAEAAFLSTLGVSGVSGGQIFTATLSQRAVAELSDQSWVRYLALSRKLRLLNAR